MPKIVDHDARRASIVEATWRLMAAEGFAATTMREIAREAGLSNGSLSPYFANKDEILAATFRHVFRLTDERMHRDASGLEGVEAIRALLQGSFPRSDEQVLVARIVVPFYDLAANDATWAAFHEESLRPWREAFEHHLVEAAANGEIRDRGDWQPLVDEIITLVTGIQVMVLLRTTAATPARQDALIDALLVGLR